MGDELNGFARGRAIHNRASPGVGRRLLRLLREVLETILPAILIALLINVFVGQATRVEGQSMEPNLHTDQRLVVEKVSLSLSRSTAV